MAKRTTTEIEKDYKRIRTVVDTTHVTYIKQIAKAVGLTEIEVKISLAKHPRVEEKIKEQLEKNKEALKAKKKAEKEALEAQKKAEQEAKRKNELESNKNEKSEVVDNAVQLEKTADFEIGFVIDASISGIDELEDVLTKLCATKAKIILTSVTIKELEKMQKYSDIQAKDARHILSMAAKNDNSFYTVFIDETLETPDDCIIKYCADHKDKVTLLTSDKTMALKARMYAVNTQYFDQIKTTNPITTHPMAYPYDKKHTLLTARKIGDKLFLADFKTEYRSIWLISNGIKYTDGVHELKIGDDVYLATKKPEYMTFAHYKITCLSDEDNCKLIYSRRIYKASEILNLPKAEYKSFMRDFKSRHNL